METWHDKFFAAIRRGDDPFRAIDIADAWRKKHMISKALRDILAERARQDEKWGEQNHDTITYLAILVEEVGELAEAALHTRFGGRAAGNLRTEAIHAAAVALAIVECIDRGEWTWPESAALRALRTAINSVECASVGPDGQELPWYVQAKEAIGHDY